MAMAGENGGRSVGEPRFERGDLVTAPANFRSGRAQSSRQLAKRAASIRKASAHRRLERVAQSGKLLSRPGGQGARMAEPAREVINRLAPRSTLAPHRRDQSRSAGRDSFPKLHKAQNNQLRRG